MNYDKYGEPACHCGRTLVVRFDGSAYCMEHGHDYEESSAPTCCGTDMYPIGDNLYRCRTCGDKDSI